MSSKEDTQKTITHDATGTRAIHVARVVGEVAEKHFRSLGKKAGVKDVHARPINGHAIKLLLKGDMTQANRPVINDTMQGLLKKEIKKVVKRGLGWGDIRIKTNFHPKSESFAEFGWCVEKYEGKKTKEE